MAGKVKNIKQKNTLIFFRCFGLVAKAIVKFFSPKTALFTILNSLIISGIFCSAIYVFAVTPMYNPGDTLDPACSLTDPNCTVTSPAYFSFSSNNFSGTGNFTTTGTVQGGIITAPTLLGGTATTSDLTLQTTSGVGTTGADMHFLVGSNGGTEAMTILNNGYVGIGTTAPGYALDIAGSPNLRLRSEDESGMLGQIKFSGSNAQGRGVINMYGESASSPNQMTIDNWHSYGDIVLNMNATKPGDILMPYGNVGIGTATPAYKLSVGSAGYTSTFNVDSSGYALHPLGLVGTPSLTFTSDTNTGLWSSGADTLNFSTAGSEWMRISSGGKVGIGTTAPSRLLHIISTDASAASLIPVEIGTPSSSLYLGYIADGAAVTQWRIRTSGSKPISLGTSGANDALYIQNAGNVGIGTTNPFYLLSVGSSSQFGVNSSGYALLPLGAVGTPSLTFTSDTNTGLWSSGADTLNFSTAGSERIRIISDGNVGIGTTTPVAKLHIVFDENTEAGIIPRGIVSEAHDATAHSAHITGRKARGTLTSPTTLLVDDYIAGFTSEGYDGNSYNRAGYMAFVTTAIGDNALSTKLLFATSKLGTENEYMTLTENGSVGIGILSPESKMHIASSASDATAVFLADSYSNSGDFGAFKARLARGTQAAPTKVISGNTLGGFSFTGAYDSSGVGVFPAGGTSAILSKAAENFNDSTHLGSFFTFETTPIGSGTRSERMRIDASGNVGIGTTTPTYLFSVAERFGVNSQGNALLPRGVVGTPSLSFISDTNTGLWSSGADTLNFSTAGSEWMRILSDGNVGIGTTSPTAKLDVNGDVLVESTNKLSIGSLNNEYIYSPAAGLIRTVARGSIQFYADSNANDGDAAEFEFHTSDADGVGTAKMVIKNSGNVGIGTTAPTVKFHVNGSVLFSGSTNASPVDGELVYDTSTHAYKYYNSNTATWLALTGGTISVTGGNWTQNGTLLYYTSGNVGIGTAAPAYKLSVSNLFGVNSSGYALLPNGLVGTPSLSFTSDTNTGLWTSGADTLNFSTAGSEWMRIKSDGNVGIGTTSPVSQFAQWQTTTIPVGIIISQHQLDFYVSGLANDVSVQGTRTMEINTTLSGSYDMGTISGLYASTYNNSTAGTITHLIGTVGRIFNQDAGNVTKAFGIYGGINSSGTGTMADAYGLYASSPLMTAGTITNYYGVASEYTAPAGGGSCKRIWSLLCNTFWSYK